jgi:hypothetical protein
MPLPGLLDGLPVGDGVEIHGRVQQLLQVQSKVPLRNVLACLRNNRVSWGTGRLNSGRRPSIGRLRQVQARDHGRSNECMECAIAISDPGQATLRAPAIAARGGAPGKTTRLAIPNATMSAISRWRVPQLATEIPLRLRIAISTPSIISGSCAESENAAMLARLRDGLARLPAIRNPAAAIPYRQFLAGLARLSCGGRRMATSHHWKGFRPTPAGPRRGA